MNLRSGFPKGELSRVETSAVRRRNVCIRSFSLFCWAAPTFPSFRTTLVDIHMSLRSRLRAFGPLQTGPTLLDSFQPRRCDKNKHKQNERAGGVPSISSLLLQASSSVDRAKPQPNGAASRRQCRSPKAISPPEPGSNCDAPASRIYAARCETTSAPTGGAKTPIFSLIHSRKTFSASVRPTLKQ